MSDEIALLDVALASTKAALNGNAPKLSEWEKTKRAALKGTNQDPLLIHDAFWKLLLVRANEIIQSPRRINQQKLAIKAVAKDLFGSNLGNSDIADLYDQLDGTLTAYEPPVEPGKEFLTYAQSWLLYELILVGLNLLVGMPGAGKSRFLVALIRAFLNDQDTFLNRKLLAGSDRHVLIIGTDQDRQQWGSLLAESGLASIVSTEVVNGQEQVLYRLHHQITLHTSGGGFKLDADGMRYIRNWNTSHQGGLLIIDSLSAVLPPGVSEGDETAGRLMRQIEMARQGNSCIVTHHCNKQSAMTGEIGVYSGSGSGTIDRAVSRHIGLAYDTHIENGKEKLHTESPRRIITSQKRGAGNQKLIVENGNYNTWDFINTAAEDRELKRQSREGDPQDTLRGWKRGLFNALTPEWQSTSQVVDALPDDLRSKPSALKQAQRNLREMDSEGLIEQDRQSVGEARWRVQLI